MEPAVGPRVTDHVARHRARPGRTKSAPTMTPEASDDAAPEPNTAGRPLAPARSNVPTIPVDPDLLRYRHRLDRQLMAWRNSRSATSLANALAIVSPPQAPPFEWHTPLLWIASIAACAVAGLAGWWVASAPAVRIGVELTETRQALQQEQDKVQKLGAALAAMSRELGDRAAALADTAAAQNQERDALQQALQQSEAAAATFAQSLAQERDALQQARQQSEAATASFAQSLARERDALQQARRQSEAAANFARSLAQERDALQQARQQSEAAAASFARSLAQERDRNQQLEQQLASRRDAVPEPVPPRPNHERQAADGEGRSRPAAPHGARQPAAHPRRHRRGAHRAGTRGRIGQRVGAVRAGRDVRPGRPVGLGNHGHARRRGAGRRPLCQGFGRRRRRGEGSIGDLRR